MSKDFDTVNHNIVLTKLEHYEAKNTNLKWFKKVIFHPENNLLPVTSKKQQWKILVAVYLALF